MQLNETVQRGNRLDLFVVLVLRIGLVQLGLLRQRSACSAAFEFFEQGNGLVKGTTGHFVLGFCIYLVGAPAHRLVYLGG